jgi:hypothetical protein
MKITFGKVWGIGMAVEPFETTVGKALACKVFLGPGLVAFTIYLSNAKGHVSPPGASVVNRKDVE